MTFTHHCAACDRTQLIFASQVMSVAASENGPELTFTCWCGATQTHVLSARPAGRDKVTLAA